MATMKLPSLNYLAQHAGHAFLRFPFSIICGFSGASIAIYLAEKNDEIKNLFPYVNLLLTFGLGIPLFFCADVFSYAKEVTTQKKYLVRALAVVVLVAIYFSLPGFDSTQNTSVPYIRYTIYNVAIHLLVAFIPFIDTRRLNGFWHYNRILFVRILAALLYSGVLFAGLAAALGSLDFLFDIDVHEELYLDLFIFIGGVFNTWFFLAGIPHDFTSVADIHEYPRGIKIFSQYVLLPLLVLYLAILYIYAGKIVFLWSWPKGIVSYLIACVAVLGILTLLLIYPYGNLLENSWIRKVSKGYYFVLVPLIALLFIAIGMRISDYGVTVNRYIILLLGIWLTIVSAYFISGKENIKFIPVSLAGILILMSFGYWGIFSVSERSQVKRLKSILEQGNILNDGKIQQEVIWLRDSLPKTLLAVNAEETNESRLSDSLHNEVKSILDYLDDHHGFKSIRGWFVQNVDSIVKESNKLENSWMRMNEAQAYMRSMGLAYIYKHSTSKNKYVTFTAAADGVVEVGSFDYLLDLEQRYNRAEEDDTFRVGDIEYRFVEPEGPDYSAWLVSPEDSIKFEVGELGETLTKKYGFDHYEMVPQEEMSITTESRRTSARLELHQLSMESNADTLQVDHFLGIVLLKVKK